MHVSFCFWSILFCFIKHISYLQSRISVVCVWTHPSCSQKATMASKSRMGALSCSFSDPRFSWIQNMLCVRHNECVLITAQKCEDIQIGCRCRPVCVWFLCGWGSWAGLYLWVSSIFCRTTAVRHVQLVLTPDSNWPKISPDSSERQTWKHTDTYTKHQTQ